MSFAYGKDHRWHDQYFEKGKAINSAGFVCAEPLAVGGHHGSLMVTAAASGNVTLAASKAFKLSVQGCDTEDGEFADIAGAPEVSVSGEASFEDGDIICSMVLPDMQRYAKIRVTSDSTHSGNVDVYLTSLAR